MLKKADSPLPEIAVHDVGEDWPVETLERALDETHALLDEAAADYPTIALKIGDDISRRWLERAQNPYLGELDRISALIGRPGAYYFNASYEWTCSTNAGAAPDGRSARLMRVLDWQTPGLGRHVIAARIAGEAGPWISMTWPGYTGVLQAMAPGRFAAAINQAPMARSVGLLPLDWMMNRAGIWKSAEPTPEHLLRRVFETALDYTEAKRVLTDTPLCVGAIYTLCGVSPGEACVIERTETEAYVVEGPASAANAWQNPAWGGRVRGENNQSRYEMMTAQERRLDDFSWLQPPVRNDLTRLAMVADPARGQMIAQGYEAEGPVTRVLSLETETA
ncbi:MAG: hypothetical protein MPJ78_01910 [Hyphomicrobiaceae bacterium]|nr:hypothetical protein [Hyphomicrobiaceae bacterium]